jgi:hypothetical protein
MVSEQHATDMSFIKNICVVICSVGFGRIREAEIRAAEIRAAEIRAADIGRDPGDPTEISRPP